VSGLTGPVGCVERVLLRRDVRRLGLLLGSVTIPTTYLDQGSRDGGTLGHHGPHHSMKRINFDSVTIGDGVHGIWSADNGRNAKLS